MKHIPTARLLLAAAILLAGCSEEDSAAQVVPGADETPVVAEANSDRVQQIADNIKFEIPQLRELPVIMGELHDGTVPGMDEGSFMIQGQTYRFLVTEDDTKLFLLAAPVIDVSRSADALAAAYEEEAQDKAQEAQERAAALAEIANDLPSRGPIAAPVTIVEFSDFQCPFCRRAHPTVQQLLAKYPEEVRLAYAHYPLPNHPWARPAAIAAECAKSQDPSTFWTLHDAYFENQESINPNNVIDRTRTFLAGSGIDLDAWNTCTTDTSSAGYQAAVATIERTVNLGRDLEVSGTPAFFVDGTLISGAKPLAEFDEAVQNALDK